METQQLRDDAAMARLRDRSTGRSRAGDDEEFGYTNVMQVPKLEKIVINIGLGEAVQNAKAHRCRGQRSALITGQKPVVTEAKKSIAAFKLRAGMPIGAMVTLRGDRMYEFYDRLVSDCAAAYPRLPRRLAEFVRWARQLHAGFERADRRSRRSITTRSTRCAVWK